MGQEFFIKSTTLENKVRSLLPSQGGLGAGFDLSASTQIVPIVDLTESAEGSNLRQDLQTAASFDKATSFQVANANTTLITNTGFYRVFGVSNITMVSGDDISNEFQLTDGVTAKTIWKHVFLNVGGIAFSAVPFDFTVFLQAGESFSAVSNATKGILSGSTRQVANIDGELTDP